MRQRTAVSLLLLPLVLPVFLLAQSVLAPNPDPRLLFIDRFEYPAERLATSHAAFTQHGWNNAKSHAWANAAGYVYTVTSIPGFTGPFPSGGTRVLAMEAKPGTFQQQTDFYLQYGNESTPNKIPGDVWIQFWIYPQDSGAQRSLHGTRNKFLYFSNDTYPSHSHKYMISLGAGTYNPHNATPTGSPTSTPFFNLAAASGVSALVYSGPGADADRRDVLGPQDLGSALVPNRWTLVKMHLDTSTTAGLWQMWIKPLGGKWRLVADWRHGVKGLSWLIPQQQVGGHRMLRMPTTVGAPTNQWHDYWLYLDDFAMATAEAALPIY